MKIRSEIRTIRVEDLHLDPNNPRLPASVLGASEEDIWRHLKAECVLEELVHSLRSNGFFVQEPLLVEARSEGGFLVLEGNRRLAALLWLHGDSRTQGAALVPPPVEIELDRLREVPAVITSRAEAHNYLGFRHVGGLKEWGPAEKARWVHAEVQARRKRGDVDTQIFFDIGRAVGLYQTSIRGLYLPYALLLAAQARGLDVQYVLSSGFGVLNRALNAPEIRNFLGLTDVSSPLAIERSLGQLEHRNLGTLISDFSPVLDAQGRKVRPSVLGDSRNLSSYASVVSDPKAWEVLRQTGDLETAFRLATRGSAEAELQRVLNMLRAQSQNLSRAEPKDLVRLKPIVSELKATIRTLEAQIIGAENELAE